MRQALRGLWQVAGSGVDMEEMASMSQARRHSCALAHAGRNVCVVLCSDCMVHHVDTADLAGRQSNL